MWRWCWLLAGCLPDGYSSDPPAPREREVLVQAIPGGTVIYQDGDGPWQLAPRVGERYGFDVEGERYAVALIDVARRRVDTLYTTVTSRANVEWHVVQAPSGPTHVLSGTVSGVEGRGGVISGGTRSETIASTPDPMRPFTIELDEGKQAVAFARFDTFFNVESLVVRRDLPIAADRIENVDFETEGTATQSVPIARRGFNPSGCGLASRFHFDNTELILGEQVSSAISPDPASWRAGDRLEILMSCQGTLVKFRRVIRFVEIPTDIPRSIEAPFDLEGASLTVDQGHFRFEWFAALDRVHGYVATVGQYLCPDQCAAPRWSAEITNEWLVGRLTEQTVLSPPDLEALGLLDPLLVPESGASWSVAAVGGDGRTRFEAVRLGTLEAAP